MMLPGPRPVLEPWHRIPGSVAGVWDRLHATRMVAITLYDV